MHPSQTQGSSTWRKATPGLALVSIALFVTPFAIGEPFGDDSIDLSRRPNLGAFEGGPTGTPADAGIDNPGTNGFDASGPESPFGTFEAGGFDIPTGGLASPLFGAQPFSQKMLRFEEFGRNELPESSGPGLMPYPPVADARSTPDGLDLDAYFDQTIYPMPQRHAQTEMHNHWKPHIEEFLGRDLDTPPLSGRPPGEDWAHQRWDEFYPKMYFQSAQTGARVNTGRRDRLQLHGYSVGEFGPSGLYHNMSGAPGGNASCAGIEVRFHPNMPIQDPLALWTFDGTLPPKLLMARYGEPILFRHWNALPIDPSANFGFGIHTITTHEHNGHNPAESDGFANAFFFPGQFHDYRWPMVLAGHDSINTDASDPRAGAPDGNGGITNLRGDWRETMSTHWFHDHMLDFTAQNVYKGNAAMMNYYSSLDRGNEGLDDGVNLRLPSGTALDWGNRDYDVNLLLADKAWSQTGQLWFNIFNLDGFIGDQLLTNWQYKPYLDVRARRYRFRILNGSVSRYLKIALVDQSGRRVPFHMVANDGNIMEHTVAFDGTLGTRSGELPTQGIAERYDIIVDFAQFNPGDRLYFVNLLEHDDGRRPRDPIPLNEVLSGAYRAEVDDDGEWRDGDPCVGKFLEFRVHAYDGVDLSMDPADFVRGREKLIPLHRPTAAEIAGAQHRTFEFGRSSGTDSQPWTIKTDGGAGFGMDPRRLSAAPSLGDEGLGDLEVWSIENSSGGWSHPIHIHFEEGIILSKDGNPPPEWELWARKDVYRVGPADDSAEKIEIALRFREFAGTYMEHCHNTQHEDHAMLLRWDIERPGQVLLMPTPEPSWDGVEYHDTFALPTARFGDGLGTTDPNFNEGDEDDDDDPPIDPPDPPVGVVMNVPTPGAAGVPNQISASGLTLGGRAVFFLSGASGPSTLSGGSCTNVAMGLLNPRSIGNVPVLPDGTAQIIRTPGPALAGQAFHFQVVDTLSCSASNVISITL